MWQFNEEKESLLARLCGCCSPSSQETAAQQFLFREFTEMGLVCRGDAIGNLYADINPDAQLNVAIVAHSDEVGLQITEIDEHGLLRFRTIGGLRATSLSGHKVTVLSQKGMIRGIVGCDPLQDNAMEKGILVKTSDLWIDIGVSSREEAEEFISIGDFAVFEADFVSLGKHRIASKALDDRIGIFIMLEVMRLLQEQAIAISVTAVSSVQEEISMRGTAACRQPFQAAIILDVDFATDIPTEHAEMGLLQLGKGVGINCNADSNPVLQRIFREVADRENIPYQSTLSRNITGGTDAAKIQTNGDIATLNINLPLRYMHTHYEVCDRRDIESAVKAVYSILKEINDKKTSNFVPWQNL